MLFRPNLRLCLARLDHKRLSTISDSHCFVTTDDPAIAIVNMNRAVAKNAFGKQMIHEFKQCIEAISAMKEVRVVLLRSLVPNVFSAGADLKERREMKPEAVSAFVDTLRNTFTMLERITVPTIAVVDGVALGGGLEAALCCDFRIASPNSKLGTPEVNLAIFPAAGGSQRLPLLVGLAKARELVFRGNIVDGEEACKIGLVNCTATDPFEESMSWAREFLTKGPLSLRAAKLAVNYAAREMLYKDRLPIDLWLIARQNGLDAEKSLYDGLIPTKDRQEGLEAFFQKRKAQYTGE